MECIFYHRLPSLQHLRDKQIKLLPSPRIPDYLFPEYKRASNTVLPVELSATMNSGNKANRIPSQLRKSKIGERTLGEIDINILPHDSSQPLSKGALSHDDNFRHERSDEDQLTHETHDFSSYQLISKGEEAKNKDLSQEIVEMKSELQDFEKLKLEYKYVVKVTSIAFRKSSIFFLSMSNCCITC